MITDDTVKDTTTGSGIIPHFDEKGCRKWKQKFYIWLMKKGGAHKGFQAGPVLRINPVPTLEMKKERARWEGHNDTAFSLTVDACELSPDATLVCDSYFETTHGAVAPADAEDDWMAPPVLASELMNLLMTRFEGHTQERLAGYLSEYTSLQVKDNETPTVMIDRMHFLILKLTQHGEGL
jgi:hypothetical protein